MKAPLIDDSNGAIDDAMYQIDHKIAAQFSAKELRVLKEQFARFDTDGSGDIDAQELAVIMDIIGEKSTPEQLTELMKEADADGDGKVSYVEFLQLVISSKKHKKDSKLLNAIKLASTRPLPTKYARLQSTRLVFGTNDEQQKKPSEEEDMSVVFGVRASWAANILLLLLKIFAYYISASQAVLAALADSVVDLLSQIILAAGDDIANKPHAEFPLGRTKIESLSVMGCAALMIVASVEVVEVSMGALVDGAEGNIPSTSKGTLVYILMGVGILIKLALFLYCEAMNVTPDGKVKSDMLSALAEDHLNDVVSNSGAIICLAIAAYTIAWWTDPLGAIIISAVIVYRWFDIISDQTDKMVGRSASAEFIEDLVEMAKDHDSRIVVDRTIAYAFGTKFAVEMDIVLPRILPFEEAHDIGVALQQKFESMDDVARATVHIDCAARTELEHIPDQERAKALEMSGLGDAKVINKKEGNITADIHNNL